MTQKTGIACLGLISMLSLSFGQSINRDPQKSSPVMNVVEITKIDSKKTTLSVKSDLADGATFSRPGGVPGGGGRGGRGGYPGAGAGSGVNTKQFKVYIKKETVLKEGATTISFDSLKVGDHIAVTGTPKGNDIEATQIAKNSK
jgi:hypothetical protein